MMLREVRTRSILYMFLVDKNASSLQHLSTQLFGYGIRPNLGFRPCREADTGQGSTRYMPEYVRHIKATLPVHRSLTWFRYLRAQCEGYNYGADWPMASGSFEDAGLFERFGRQLRRPNDTLAII